MDRDLFANGAKSLVWTDKILLKPCFHKIPVYLWTTAEDVLGPHGEADVNRMKVRIILCSRNQNRKVKRVWRSGKTWPTLG